jgi:hypothetical protein
MEGTTYYFNSAIIPGKLHCICKPFAAHPYSAIITLPISSWLLPDRTSPCARVRSFSTLLRYVNDCDTSTAPPYSSPLRAPEWSRHSRRMEPITRSA